MKVKKLRIGSNVYKVKQRKKLTYGDDELNGICFFDKCLIELAADLPSERKKQVLTHEVVHALFHEAGYVFDADGFHSEDAVIRVSNVLDGFLKDNIETLNKIYKR